MRIASSILLASLLFCLSCQKKDLYFHLVSTSHTGINFNNKIEENDSINVFEFMNIYTGAGVAVGDINNDGLVDVYFSGNMVSGRLYLNKGNLKFEDISEKAGIVNDRWGTGATMVDINQDGFLDIYVCVSGSAKEAERANMLFVNNGDMTFTEKAAEYGLADTRQSMHAVFFDYDKDQDLDLYLLVNPAAYEQSVNSSRPRKTNGEAISNDRLYRNEGNGTFTDVTLKAGILTEGYGLGVGISDINNDSWPDIYISNDFVGSDILYINQRDGTFKDEIADYIDHTSYAGMGNDIADLNNDGKPDILVLDMSPEDNARKKIIISSLGYDRFESMIQAGYQPQYTRNTLQLNQGKGKFSEVGFMAGISSTDWSWSALAADYNNDGKKDIYITNGFLRDLGNLDYIHYQNIYNTPLGDTETKIKQKLQSIQNLPSAKLTNYMYRNTGDINFENVSKNWGFTDKSCSNGAAFADLDNDGDLDLLINNVNQEAFVYENKSNLTENNYLKIRLKGKKGNINGLGSRLKVTTKENRQYYEHFLSRGYESSVDPTIHFGLGTHQVADSVEIWWPDDSYQSIYNVSSNQLIVLDQSKAAPREPQQPTKKTKKWFKNITDSLQIKFLHSEDQFIDFKLQPILPHMHSRNGPGVAIGDVNQDGLEDFYIGGASGQFGELFIQTKDGFKATNWQFDKIYEDMGALFFDADNNGTLDLYVVSGGVLESKNEEVYQDRLYLNDGYGNFHKSTALPRMVESGSTVVANDFDKDGDLDLFIGGRINPGKYPMPSKSYILENLSNENPKALTFKDISDTISGFNKLTMVTAALWTDFDNDGWADLLVSGEFMPILFLKNQNGTLMDITSETGLQHTEGWWNSIAGGDFDNDGDTDYILGNWGLNNKFKASDREPLSIHAKDFDKDGRIDPIMSFFIDGENQISHSRDELIAQINAMRGRFKTYKSYAESSFEKSFLSEELLDAYVLKSYSLESSYLENLGNGTFKIASLPRLAQIAPVKGILVEDFDGDGNLDAILTGNFYSSEVSTGRYDALKGMILKGNGDGNFSIVPLEKSGFLNNFDSSGLSLLRNSKGNSLLIVANNNGPLKIFDSQNPIGKRIISPDVKSQYADIIFKNGKHRKQEFYFGSGYLSQSSQSISIGDHIKEVRITNMNGITKTAFLNE